VKIAVVGTGYVGLVVGACLAEAGNYVLCADVDEKKIAGLKKNVIPIYEPGLEPLVSRNQANERLKFTTDIGTAIEESEVVFIAVGTPPDEDGSADLQHVIDVARLIGDHMNRSKVVVTKSTVPVGTANKVRAAISERTAIEFSVCSNPEFLKEGAAVDDFLKPDRVVVGVESERGAAVMRELYSPFVRTGNPLIMMDIASAELTKYAANSMLATRISFMNQIAALCEAVGADAHMVRKGMGSDPRIGRQFLFPGPGYGGSCLPKDVRALIKTAGEFGVPLDIVNAAESTNARQKTVLFEKLINALGGLQEGHTISVWGLAFKAQTDDMRESPAISLIESLIESGASVNAFDPKASANARELFGQSVNVLECPYDALVDSDALVVVTEWMEFRNPDFERMKMLMRQPVIVDGRNLYDPVKMVDFGFRYSCIGRRAPA